MDERSRVLLATCLGAVAGGVWGWLYMTENGRRVRDQIEPKLDDFDARTDARARHGREGAQRGERRVAVAQRRGRRAHRAAGRRREGVRMMANLDTTNMLLGIMAAVSVLEALLLIGIGIGGFMVYRRVMQLVTDSKRGRSRRCARRWSDPCST